jgi:hypothetical protein
MKNKLKNNFIVISYKKQEINNKIKIKKNKTIQGRGSTYQQREKENIGEDNKTNSEMMIFYLFVAFLPI